MGTTTPWVGDAFFARDRTPEQIEAILQERFDTDVEAAARQVGVGGQRLREKETRKAQRGAADAAEKQLHREWMRLTKERYENATRVEVDEEAYGFLPVRTSGTVLSVKDPAEVHANDLAARRFIRRVNGRDLRRELDGYRKWLHHTWAHTPAMLRWTSAPIDPLSPEEAATVGVGFQERVRREQEQQKAAMLYVKGEVRPVGMTLERAIAIAHAAQDAIDNGTASTYE